MKKNERTHAVGGVFALLLFSVFAVCILSVLLTGAGTYRRLTERDQRSAGQRTAVQYIATKVRQGDRLGAVSVETFGGQPALVLAEEAEGETYLTRIYVLDGCLRELFSAADAEMAPEDGEKVLEAERLLLTREGDALVVELLTEGVWQTLTLTLRSGEGAAS